MNDPDRLDHVIGAVFVVNAILAIAFVAFLIWAGVKLVSHFVG